MLIYHCIGLFLFNGHTDMVDDHSNKKEDSYESRDVDSSSLLCVVFVEVVLAEGRQNKDVEVCGCLKHIFE